MLLYFHPDDRLRFGTALQTHSQDAAPNITRYAFRPIMAGKQARFLSVFMPHAADVDPQPLVESVKTHVSDAQIRVRLGDTTVVMKDEEWSVTRR